MIGFRGPKYIQASSQIMHLVVVLKSTFLRRKKVLFSVGWMNARVINNAFKPKNNEVSLLNIEIVMDTKIPTYYKVFSPPYLEEKKVAF